MVYRSKEFKVWSALTPCESVEVNVVFTVAWTNRLPEHGVLNSPVVWVWLMDISGKCGWGGGWEEFVGLNTGPCAAV